jgi:hypothetical protein
MAGSASISGLFMHILYYEILICLTAAGHGGN